MMLLFVWQGLFALFFSSLNNFTDFNITNLWQNTLPQAFLNTFWVVCGTLLFSTLLGLLPAWLLSQYRFFGSRFLNWGLLLPLAIPTYIMAFAYLDLWHPLGPIQTFIRAILGYETPRQLRLFDLRQTFGVILVLSFSLFPYVFMYAKVAFTQQSANLIESAQLLNYTKWQIFRRVQLPLIKPHIAAGLLLVFFETLNDMAAAEFLGTPTLTVYIYHAWFTQGNIALASQASLLILSILLLIYSLSYFFKHTHLNINNKINKNNKNSDFNTNFSQTNNNRRMDLKQLNFKTSMLASLICGTPFVLAFLLPIAYLIYAGLNFLKQNIIFSNINILNLKFNLKFNLAENIEQINIILGEDILQVMQNTFFLAAAAALIVSTIGIILIYVSKHIRFKHFINNYLQMIGVAYAMPANVLAIGALTSLLFLEDVMMIFFKPEINNQINHSSLILNTTLGLLLVYIMRFIRIANSQFDYGFKQQNKNMLDAAKNLGHGKLSIFWQIELPLLKPFVLASLLLIFVDVIKELPIALLLRPVGFETLATYLYKEASRGNYEHASLFALIIVLIGLLPIFLLNHSIKDTNK